MPVYVTELAAAISSITFEDNRAVFERGGEALWFKLRDWESDDVLTRRYGTAWGQVVTERCPPGPSAPEPRSPRTARDPSRAGARSTRFPSCSSGGTTRCICTARQIVRYGEYVLPDSWRHPHQRVLNNRQLVHSSAFFGRYLDRTRADRRRCAPLARTTTSTPSCRDTSGTSPPTSLSRVWGWEIARREDPTVRPLLSVSDEPKQIPGFQQQIFAALGIPARRCADHRPARGGRGRDAVRGQSSAGEPVLRRPGPGGGLAAD